MCTSKSKSTNRNGSSNSSYLRKKDAEQKSGNEEWVNASTASMEMEYSI